MKRLIAIAISGMLFCGAADAQVYGTQIPTGTSGASIPLLNGNNTYSGNAAFTGTNWSWRPVSGNNAQMTIAGQGASDQGIINLEACEATTCNAGIGSVLNFYANTATRFGQIGMDAPIRGSGTAKDLVFLAGTGLSVSLCTNNSLGTCIVQASGGNVTFPAQLIVASMTQTATAQSGTVCWSAAGLTYDATLGCLASLPELKNFHGEITGALVTASRLKTYWASWKLNTPEWKGGDHEVQPVFNARQVAAVDKRLVSYGPDGKLRGVRYAEMTAFLLSAIQEQQKEISGLHMIVEHLENDARCHSPKNGC